MPFIYPGIAGVLDYGVRGRNVSVNPTMFNLTGGAPYIHSHGEFASNGRDDVIIDGSRQNMPLTLLRDFHVRSLVMINAANIDTNGYRIFSQKLVSLDTGSWIHNDGAIGLNTTLAPGGLGGASGSIRGGFKGGHGSYPVIGIAVDPEDGGGSTTGNAGGPFTPAINGSSCATIASAGGAPSGGTGATGSVNVGGVGGTCDVASATDFRSRHFAQTGFAYNFDSSVVTNVPVFFAPWGGAGGGGGGTDLASKEGGGGGGGGGIVYIATPVLTIKGISAVGAVGGEGGPGTAGGGKGGGGGQGGAVILHCNNTVIEAGSTINVGGGAGGASSGGGFGITGSNGMIHFFSESRGIYSISMISIPGDTVRLPPIS